MPLSLNIIVAGLVASIALIVGATCVAISLSTSFSQINSVGIAWASGMASGVAGTLRNYLETIELELLSGSYVAQTQAGNKFPTDLAAEGKNWTIPYIIYLQESAVKLQYKFVSRTV